MELKYRKLQIVLCDDDSNILNLLKIFLKKEGHDVYPCDKSQDCLIAADEGWADVIFLDLNMPNISGLETLRILKSSQKTADIPVVMLTAHGEAPLIKKSVELGACEYILKPFDKRMIRDRLAYFSAYLTSSDIRDLVKKVCMSDRSSFLGQGVSATIQEDYDCYPLLFDFDQKKGNLLVRKDVAIKRLKTAEDKVLEDNLILYLKSTLRWFPIWPHRKYEPTWDENINELIDIDLKI